MDIKQDAIEINHIVEATKLALKSELFEAQHELLNQYKSKIKYLDESSAYGIVDRMESNSLRLNNNYTDVGSLQLALRFTGDLLADLGRINVG